MPTELLHWWAAFDEIRIPATLCGLSPDGQRQAAAAFITRADWLTAFNNTLWITGVLALAAVLITYETRVMGHLFWKRWWKGLALGALLIAAVCFLYLALTPVTAGCEFGQAQVKIPTSNALLRASVALIQGALAFVVFSWLLTLVARWSRRPKWIANAQIPFRF